ncbi:MAG: hypothetical protein Q9181_000798, partial [Wetmoreana brouardii]
MAPLPKWKPPKTLVDLYIERDQTPWYWRTAAMSSAALVMIGFLIFPTAFPSNMSEDLSSRGSGIAAGLLLAIGYSMAVVLVLACKSWLFQMDVIFVPCLFSSTLGLFNVIIALSTHDGKQSRWSSSSIAAVVLAAISSAVYLTLTLYTFRNIHIVRARDTMHRHPSDSQSYDLLPEDEMQRQQLLRLLLQRENSKKSSEDVSQSTFRIDLPDSIRRMETRLTAPQHTYASRESDRRDSRTGFTLPPLSPFSSMSTPSPYQAVATNEQSPSPPPASAQQQQQQNPPNTTTRIQRNASASSSQAPPYSALSNNGTVRFPTEKENTMTYNLDGEIHPLERERQEKAREREKGRPHYRVVERSPIQDFSKLMEPPRRDDGRGDGGRW